MSTRELLLCTPHTNYYILVELPVARGPFIFYEVEGAGGIWRGSPPQKMALKGDQLKKIREKGGHVKYYLHWRGGRRKKISCLGGVNSKLN